MIRNGVQQPERVMVFDISSDQVDACCAAFPGQVDCFMQAFRAPLMSFTSGCLSSRVG